VAETLDRPAFTTDVIVGFPGETEEDFAETLEACRQIGFSKIHVFPFSPRRDTPAAEMPDQIPKQVKSIRAEKLAMLETELKRSYLQSLVGSTLQVLVETIDAGRMQVGGTSCRYATVRANSRDAEFFEDLMPLEGQLIGVRCKQFNDRDGTLLASFV
jgi:threonylcarbamoyladenosine tRNA methylthiotransferase MtaB